MSTDLEIKKAYNAGAKAYQDGKTRFSGHVYARRAGGGEVRTAWFLGWDTAQKYKLAVNRMRASAFAELLQ